MHDISLTPAAVFAQAGPVVKTVLVLLLAASILSWVWIVEAVVAFMRLSAAPAAAATAMRQQSSPPSPPRAQRRAMHCREAPAKPIVGRKSSTP